MVLSLLPISNNEADRGREDLCHGEPILISFMALHRVTPLLKQGKSSYVTDVAVASAGRVADLQRPRESSPSER